MEGLVEEGKEMFEEEEGETLDAGLISAAQRVEHYDRVIAIEEANHSYAHIRQVKELGKKFLREIRPAKLLGLRTSPITANTDTTKPPAINRNTTCINMATCLSAR